MPYLDGQQASTPVYLDDSGNPAPATPTPAQNLQGAVSYASQQDPVKYAKLLQLQKLTGIPPAITQGNEQQVQQKAATNSIDPHYLTTMAPQTSTWASNPDNAAVSGVDEIHRLAGIEQNAAGMRGTVTPWNAPWWVKPELALSDAYHAVTGQTPDQTKQRLFEYPLTRWSIGSVGAASALVGNVGSFFGWHGDGQSSANLLQRIQAHLSPEANTDPAATFHKTTGFDSLVQNIAPMIPAVIASGGTSLLAKTLGMSPNAAKVLAGLTVGGMFTADQGGKTYTSVADAGGSDYAARLAANRVATINALPNALFGATEVVPFLRNNPLLTSLGLGGLTGASGQVAQNVVTGKPTLQGVGGAAVQGAAMQGGLHIGTDAFLGHLTEAVDATEQSALRERSPEKFHEALQTIFQGDESLRIPAEQFANHFKQDASAVASGIGATNYAEAVLSGGDVEIPKANFLARMDPEDQKALLPHVVDPATGLTETQHAEAREQLEQWLATGGAEQLQADTAAADAENAATPEFQAVKEDLRQRYIDAGESPEVAETLATSHANVVSNLASESGRTPGELMAMYNPKVVAGEAPDAVAQGMTRLYHGSAEPGRFDGPAWFSTNRDYAKNFRPDSELQYVDYPTDKLAERVGWDESQGPIAHTTHNLELDASETGPRKAFALQQASPEGPRGWFRTLPDGSFEIGKTSIGDLSTFVHEPAHGYLQMIGDLAKREGASDILKSDHAKILDFLGAKDGESLTREQHEKWARANEQYLREGKAPSAGLRGVFQRFAVWLGAVYKKASDLGVELTPEIRDVFDRMYAAEEGVDRAAQEAGPHLFTSAEEAGWTDEEFQKYADDNNVSVEQAKSHILGMLNEAAVRERSQAWRDEESNARQAITEQIDASPEYKAIRSLRKGQLEDGTPLTMSRESLVAQFGDERVNALQQKHPGLYRSEGGVDAETAAEIHGFSSAEEMMQAFESNPRRSVGIENATRAYMTSKHGDIRFDGSLSDQARIALENDKRADGLYRELTALKKKLAATQGDVEGQKQAMRSINVAPIEAYREAAHQMVESKAVADLQPTRYLDASRKYSREAFDALRKGDAQEAADAKHKELMNHFLFREATKAKEYVGKFEAYAKRMQTVKVQQKLGLAGGEYLDQFNRIMGRYGLGPNAGPGESTLAEWTAAQYADGKEPAIDPAILNEARTVNYRQAPVAEIRLVHDALVNVRKLASLELGMEVNGRKIEFNAAMENMSMTAHEKLGTKPTRVLKGNATFAEKVADLAQRGDALLMRTERLMEWLDGGKAGPWHDNLWNLAADSQGNEYRLQEEVTKRVGDALENMPKEQREKMLEKVTVQGIPETVTRHDLVSMAFNMGNEGNFSRLQKTFLAHGWDASALDNIPGMLTREEWQFVQDGWDSLKPLGVAQAELEKRLTGLPPAMVKPTPLHLKLADGTEMDLAGGYYPVVMDSRFSKRGAQQDAGMTAQNLMEAGYGRAATSRGNMKERTGFGGPLQLDYEQVLTQHTAKVIKDITHREFMLAANKLLMDPQIRQTMRETLGEGYEEKMMPWLRTIINDRNGSVVQGLGDFSQMMRTLRTNLTMATLSYKISTSLLQWTHAPRMLLSTKPASYAQAMVDFMAHPSEMTEQIKSLSPNEMAFRGDNLDRDIRETLRGEPGIRRTVARVGNVSIKYTDHILSFPLWLSVYRDALKEHIDLPEDRAQYLASHAADSAVRLGLGSGAPKDLPPIMRNNDMAKVLTMFYSFHNGIYGQVRDIVHQAKGMRDVPKMTYGLALSVLVPAVLSSIVTGNGPKDDENKGAWAAKKALLFGSETIPMMRDLASALDRGGDVKLSPIVDVLSRGAKTAREATADKEDKDWTGIGLNALETGMDFAGVPGTTQALKPLRYMHQVDQGNIANPNVWDATVGHAPHR